MQNSIAKTILLNLSWWARLINRYISPRKYYDCHYANYDSNYEFLSICEEMPHIFPSSIVIIWSARLVNSSVS